MVTLSEDGDSWKASGIRRRDFRSSKEEPEINRHMGNRKKNTKKWCKGKVGKKHTVEGHRMERYCHVDFCTVCRKDMKHYWKGWNWSNGPFRCPSCPRD